MWPATCTYNSTGFGWERERIPLSPVRTRRCSMKQETGYDMAGKNTAAFGIYTSRSGVEKAVDELKAAGYRSTDISVLFPENAGTKDFAHEKNTKAPEGA